jgi:hypothetical protein
MTDAKGMSKYKLDLVGVQEVTWDTGRTEPAGEYTFSLDNWLIDGGEIVSLTRRPLFIPRKIPGTHFC